MQKNSVLIFISLLLATTMEAQESKTAPLINLPLAVYGVNDIQKRELLPFQEYYRKLLQERWPGLKSLLESLDPKTIPTRTQKNVLKNMSSSAVLDPATALRNIDIQRPALCRYDRDGVLFIQSIYIREQSIYTRYAHRLIPELFASSRHISPAWSALEEASRELLAPAPSNPTAPNTIMKLSFFNRRPLLGKPKVDAACLNMLLAEKLQESVRIMPEEGNFELQVLYDILNLKEPSKRHNRVLSLDWQMTDMEGDRSGQFPKQLNIKSHIVESVISGRSSPDSNLTSNVTFVLEKNPRSQIQIKGSEGLVKQMAMLAKQLPLREDPLVIGTYGAWAYLHLGRAYGLTMNTRMVSREDPNIQGHVVAFFGPESGLKDSEGNSVQEGAILFIRQGQQKVKKGMTFTFDERRYPQQASSQTSKAPEETP